MISKMMSLGYSYGTPVSPDYIRLADQVEKKPVPVILFPRIDRIDKTYTVLP